MPRSASSTLSLAARRPRSRRAAPAAAPAAAAVVAAATLAAGSRRVGAARAPVQRRGGMDHSVEVEPEPQPDDGSIGLESFQKWTSLPTLPNETGQQPKESRFPSKKRVTEKIHLWVGEIWRVNTDCIVNTTSENFAERGGVSADIFRVAGPQLAAECSTLEGCRTGEAKLTASYGLPCKAVIHTVGPKYNIKYKTAAENALHHCYFHCLEEMVEEGHRTIAFPVVNTEKKGYPVEDAAHTGTAQSCRRRRPRRHPRAPIHDAVLADRPVARVRPRSDPHCATLPGALRQQGRRAGLCFCQSGRTALV